MIRALQQFVTVTAYELVDSFRSRWALVLLILYLLGSIASTYGFIEVLHKVEVKVVESMGLTASKTPGSATETLWKSKQFEDIVTGLMDNNRTLAKKMLSAPPVALFYSWLSLTFVPLLIIMISSSRISEEVSHASVRYVLFRTPRSTWCLGKWAGQSLLLLGALLLSAVGAWGVAVIRMRGFEPVAGAWALLGFSFKTWIYGFAYLGLALGVSQVFRSPVIATAVGLVGMIFLAVLSWVAEFRQSVTTNPIWPILLKCTPRGYKAGLRDTEWAQALPASVMLLVLGAVFFMAGYAVFARRDQ